jgi:RHS repeat-associated protein
VDVGEGFTAFGNRRSAATWSGPETSANLNTIAGLSREGYTFQTTLGLAMGMNHMNGRVQDAVSGRFLSPDPRIPHPGNTQSWNRYAYTNNNPLKFVDPSGFDDDDAGGGGGGGDGAPPSDPDPAPDCASTNTCDSAGNPSGATPGGTTPGTSGATPNTDGTSTNTDGTNTMPPADSTNSDADNTNSNSSSNSNGTNPPPQPDPSAPLFTMTTDQDGTTTYTASQGYTFDADMLETAALDGTGQAGPYNAIGFAGTQANGVGSYSVDMNGDTIIDGMTYSKIPDIGKFSAD